MALIDDLPEDLLRKLLDSLDVTPFRWRTLFDASPRLHDQARNSRKPELPPGKKPPNDDTLDALSFSLTFTDYRIIEDPKAPKASDEEIRKAYELFRRRIEESINGALFGGIVTPPQVVLRITAELPVRALWLDTPWLRVRVVCRN